VNFGIYWIFLTICRHAIRPISPTILYNIPITHRIHTPCHISLTVQQFLVHKKTVAVPNCMWLLSLPQTQELTQFIVCLQYVEFNRKQQQVQEPSQIGLPEVLQPRKYSRNKCVCVLYACVQKGSAGCDWVRFCTYVTLCTVYAQVTVNPLSSHPFLCTKKYGFCVSEK
jgi:hypothetical protein